MPETADPPLAHLLAAAENALGALLSRLECVEGREVAAALTRTAALCRQLDDKAAGLLARRRAMASLRLSGTPLLRLPRNLLVATAARFLGGQELGRLETVCSFFNGPSGFSAEVASQLRLRRERWPALLWRRHMTLRQGRALAREWGDHAGQVAACLRQSAR